LVRPSSADTREATPAKLPGILVVHENRGLNPHIEDVARRMALANFTALAPDALTSVGGLSRRRCEGWGVVHEGRQREEDRRLRGGGAVAQGAPRRHRARLGVTGFCYGGGISNTLAVRLGGDLAAAAPFYGGPPQAADMPKIQGPILVHHGELDTRWRHLACLRRRLKAAGVPHEGYIYPGAVHGFNCDATPERYKQGGGRSRVQRTIDWFNKYVRG